MSENTDEQSNTDGSKGTHLGRPDSTATGRDYVAFNRSMWDEISDSYQKHQGASLSRDGLRWGEWQLPEDQLQVLGDVSGKDVLEVGCGAAQCSIALAKKGARPVGVDVSPRQLAHGHELQRASGMQFPLLEANAESIPLSDESFDIIFSDHGAMTYTDPALSVPEMVRLLRPGGLLAFNTCSPFRNITWDDEQGCVTDRLTGSYFGLYAFERRAISFQLTYGDWLRLFYSQGLVVEDLIEPRPPANVEIVNEYVAVSWARRFPLENIWKLRKGAGASVR